MTIIAPKALFRRMVRYRNFFHTIPLHTGGGGGRVPQDLAKIPIFGLHVEISNVGGGASEIRRVIRGVETG